MEEAGRPDLGVPGDIDAWAERCLDLLTSLPGVRRAGIAVVEGGGRRLRFVSAEHAGAGPVDWCLVDAYDDVPLNTAVRTGRVVVGTLAQLGASHPAFVERQRDTGSEALAAVPLVVGRHRGGGFVLFYGSPRAFADSDVDELRALGAELGEGLRRAQVGHIPQADGWVPALPPAGALVVQFSVGSEPAAVGPARQELRDTLRAWEIDPDVIEVATLCLSELVTNAVVHAASGCWVRVTNDAGSVAVTVRSPGTLGQALDGEAEDPLQVHGRGLQLVDALAGSWGSDVQDGGLTTWFVLAG